ncbi:hypothetical protein RhiirA1_401747 [Rhizophagus irregularis]|uniref:Uncharacterized protein n=1 Tax=Rhizophagus irregularis TaxID=588596 RepID=A0A2N0R108_9GLOM|nr:hypothetical protein RhiirA1_401747 [Rhizophagus irregularis]
MEENQKRLEQGLEIDSDQEFESPNYNEPIFICNYPTSSFITIIYYEVNGKRHERSYNILSLGEYPSNVKYTQRGKKNSVVYKIPNAYKVETILGGFQIICESNYLPNGKIKYSIEWKDNNNVSKIISNTRSSSALLDILVPIWKKGSSSILTSGDTIKLKFGGDGHIVTHQYSHVMFTVCLLNEKDEVLKPTANSNFFCLYCECSKELRADMNHSWSITGNNKGHANPCLFPMIKTGNWIPDELHVMLRITDVLLGCFFYQLMEDINQFKKSISTLIEQEMHRIGITHFQFYESKTKGKYDWTTLNGVEKLNVLKNFEVTRSVSGDHGRKMEFLWHEFLRLYLFLRQNHITEEEIDSFEQAAKSWILKFCEPTIGKSNSANKKKKECSIQLILLLTCIYLHIIFLNFFVF